MYQCINMIFINVIILVKGGWIFRCQTILWTELGNFVISQSKTTNLHGNIRRWNPTAVWVHAWVQAANSQLCYHHWTGLANSVCWCWVKFFENFLDDWKDDLVIANLFGYTFHDVLALKPFWGIRGYLKNLCIIWFIRTTPAISQPFTSKVQPIHSILCLCSNFLFWSYLFIIYLYPIYF